MHWERASEDIYIFTSDRYAQVTASLIVSGNTGILIDTLPFPSETAQIALFARKRCPDGVRFVIYTGHEADHVYGAFLFPKAEIIAHEMAREILIERGFAALQRAKEQSQEFTPVQLRLPTFTFTTNSVTLRMPGKTLEIIHTPGHTPDCVSVLLHEERILFSGDTVMALPTITNGDPEQLKKSLETVGAMQLENIVQGHGEIILRGEIRDTLRRQVNYLDNLRNKVQKLIEAGGSRDDAKAITIEQCGMPRVLLNGAVVQLHLANVLATYDRLMAAKTAEAVRSAATAEKSKATKKPATKQPAAKKEKPARTKKSDAKPATQKRTSSSKPATKKASKPTKRKAAPQTKLAKKNKGKGR
ncbi:MAG: MBL fold metallo-hydrolase [Candidatus Brachytrichaceae bacterium NZ_4S206]|jgi:glyoxylase-like metal-dependent hydrolase (beta-lactamase superfamily II)